MGGEITNDMKCLNDEEHMLYKAKCFNPETQKKILKAAITAAGSNDLKRLKSIMAINYYVIRPDVTFNEKNQVVTKFYLDNNKKYTYVTLNDHGNELLASAMRGHAITVVEYLLVSNVLFSGPIMHNYINRQINLVLSLHTAKIPLDIIDIFLQQQDPDQCTFFAFKYYFRKLLSWCFFNSNTQLQFLLNNLNMCMSQNDQVLFLQKCHDFLNINNIFVTLYSGTNNPTPQLMGQINEFKLCLSHLSRFGFPLYLKSFDTAFEELVLNYKFKFDGACLIYDINQAYYFYGYSQKLWHAHEIKPDHIPFSQRLLQHYSNKNEAIFLTCDHAFFPHATLHHQPFYNLIDKLDDKIQKIAIKLKFKLISILKEVLPTILDQVAQESSCLFLKNISGKAIFTKLYKQIKTTCFPKENDKPSQLGEKINVLTMALNDIYNEQANKQSYKAKLLKSTLNKFEAKNIITIECTKDLTQASLIKHEIIFTDYYNALVPFIDNDQQEQQRKLTMS